MSADSRLLRAARRVLYPLIRILLRNGISAPVFQELARKVFVDVADQEFRINGKAQTLARVSVLTGLNRKEVARLHKLEGITDEDKIWWNRAGKVLDAWLTDSTFHSDAGFPLDLSFADASPNFTDLVKKYSGDMYPRSVADELLRLGAIQEVNGVYRMSKKGYVPSADTASLFDVFGVDVGELIDTIDYNILHPDDPWLQYKVVADNLPDEHIEAFREYSKRVSLNAVDEVRRWLVEHDAGSNKSTNNIRWRAGVGTYQVFEKNEVDPAANTDKKDKD